VVTIDAHGGSLHKDVEASSSAKLLEIQSTPPGSAPKK
jgi:hypothetical protein